jgi:hypothetical protein
MFFLAFCISLSKEKSKERMSENKYPYQTVNGMKKRVHRHIMEEHLGRELEFDEHVYHINGNSTDNQLENLIIIKKKHKVKS